jgi:transcriptional regulator with XRE-family HTH domain
MPQEAPVNLVDETLGRKTALKLRAEGLSYKEIASEMGVSLQCAHNWVTAALEEARKDTAESIAELRELESTRLDRLLVKWFKKAEEGNAEALSAVLRIAERRAKMYGIDAPTRTANMNVDVTAENPALLMAEARRLGIPLVEPKEVKALTCQVTTPSSDESKLPEPSQRCDPPTDCSTTSDMSSSIPVLSPEPSETSPETGSGSSPGPMLLVLTGSPDYETAQENLPSLIGSLSPEDTIRRALLDEPSISSSDSPRST